MLHLKSVITALLSAAVLVSAQVQQSIVNPTTAASTATPLPSASNYAYVGCWNETTQVPNTGGLRALSNGNSSANNTMTISSCVSFCASSNSQFAGLEYGRECYCASYLSSFSVKLNESRCNYACNGNGSEVCGGSLALTLYNRTGDGKSSGGVAVRLLGGGGGGAAWYGFAGIGMLVLAAVL